MQVETDVDAPDAKPKGSRKRKAQPEHVVMDDDDTCQQMSMNPVMQAPALVEVHQDTLPAEANAADGMQSTEVEQTGIDQAESQPAGSVVEADMLVQPNDQAEIGLVAAPVSLPANQEAVVEAAVADVGLGGEQRDPIADRKARQSRKSSAYHAAKRAARKAGLSADEQVRLAKAAPCPIDMHIYVFCRVLAKAYARAD